MDQLDCQGFLQGRGFLVADRPTELLLSPQGNYGFFSMHSDLEENKNLTEIRGQPSLNRAIHITLGNSWGRKEGGIRVVSAP